MSGETLYDYFRRFDNRREQAEPYAFSNFVHGYDRSRGMRVLDYGCGNGYVLGHYARHGASVTGVDVGQEALALARGRFALLGLDGTFTEVDGKTLPFESEAFDIVCSMGVLHHVRDPRPIVAELRRVLRPGGKLVVMLYHRDSFRYRVLFRWRRLAGPAPYRGRPVQEILNMNDGIGNPWGAVYSRDETRELLSQFERHTFFIRKLDASELALYLPGLAGALRRLLLPSTVDALGRRYGWNLYCVAFRNRG